MPKKLAKDQAAIIAFAMGGFLLFMGLFLMLFAVIWGWATWKIADQREQFRTQGRDTTGVVTRRWSERLSRGSTSRFLDVKFFDGELEVVGTAAVNNPDVWARYDVPQKVNIRFVPGRIEWIILPEDTVEELEWWPTAVLGAMAVGFVLAGCGAIWLGLRLRSGRIQLPAGWAERRRAGRAAPLRF